MRPVSIPIMLTEIENNLSNGTYSKPQQRDEH